jgi:hypothetical protein
VHHNIFTSVGWFFIFSYEEPPVLVFKKKLDEFGSNFGFEKMEPWV